MAAPALPPLPPGGAPELRKLSCVGQCGADTPLVPASALPAHLATVPLWRLAPDRKSITRSFTARNFRAAMAFLNGCAEVCEAETHHANFHLTDYRDVSLSLSTHAVGSQLTLLDFIVAAKLDAVPVDYSPKWEREHLPGAPVGSEAGRAATVS